jgi:integrative and conjugative element protein (TIGR02256 family)
MKKVVKYVATFDSIDRLIKFKLDEQSLLDILDSPLKIIYRFRQMNYDDCEAGGLVIGYENLETGNYTVVDMTLPGAHDLRSRVQFIRKDSNHLKVLDQLKLNGGYIGTWHTHPQAIPIPSTTDIIDWKESMEVNANKTRYLVFVIAGTEQFRVWIGDCKLKQLKEIVECEKINEIYII